MLMDGLVLQFHGLNTSDSQTPQVEQIFKTTVLPPFRSLRMENAFQTGLLSVQHLFAKTRAKLLKPLGPFYEAIQAKDLKL